MRCSIISIGKWKSGPEKALFEHYAARLPYSLTLKELECKKALSGDALKAKEAELLLEASEDYEVVWALDEHGKDLTSKTLATQWQALQDRGVRSMAWVIGGADGLHESVKKQSQQLVCLGRMTWPHLLVRGLLAEQLYRAHTILTGHPYHRE